MGQNYRRKENLMSENDAEKIPFVTENILGAT